MPTPLRQKRVADRIQQELSDLLQTMNDPRLQLVTVTVVNIDRELEYANVFVSTVGDAERQREVMQALNHAKGYIRREVSRRLQLRRAPEVIFHWDPSPEKAEHIEELLDQLRGEAPPDATPPTPAPDGPEAESPDHDDN